MNDQLSNKAVNILMLHTSQKLNKTEEVYTKCQRKWTVKKFDPILYSRWDDIR